jgi:hypothetical protein
MSRWAWAVMLTAIVVGLNVTRAEAASLKIKGTADARAVIVNDGSGSVGTSNGSSEGDASLWSSLGYGDPSELVVVGSFASGVDLDSEGTLLSLWLVATVPGCSDCDPLGDKFNNLEGNSELEEVLAWVSTNLLFLGPNGPTSLPLTILADQRYSFALSSTDATDLAAVLANYGPDNVYIGLSGLIQWPPTPSGFFPPDATFATGVPEPASLTLFGSGLLVLAARLRRRRAARRR